MGKANMKQCFIETIKVGDTQNYVLILMNVGTFGNLT